MGLVIGVDEAGRGPVLGPLVICAACFEESDESWLKEQGVADSKRLTRNMRERMVPLIEDKIVACGIVEIPARVIDKSLLGGNNLNSLEVRGFAAAIKKVLDSCDIPGRVYVDAADVKPERFKNNLLKTLGKNLSIISMHKADERVTCVGAASIIAKTRRDRAIDRLREEHGDIGSGYPSDRKTIEFIKDYYLENGKFPPFARKTWDTIKRIKKELGILDGGQKTLI